MTLQILFAPATNALGRSGIPLRAAIAGAVILPTAFLIGMPFGAFGLAIAWVTGFPLLTMVTAALSLPVIGVRASELGRAILPGLAASAGMVVPVLLLDSVLPPLAPPLRLAALVSLGAATYPLLLFLFARSIVEEVLQLVRRTPTPARA